MPAIPLRRQRAGEVDDDEGEESDILPRATPASHRSSTSKRARLSVNGDASSPQNTRRRPTEGHNELTEAAAGAELHQPGSIVRVKLQNFVTYTSAEFFPGPSLNMVIGPNGTGKSTLVCAICLGLGWGPQHLGRAKDVSEYVKHGCHEAIIEIELAGSPGPRKANPVIRRQIKREGNKSSFTVNGRPSTVKGVLDLARSFSIQIDNLCQFLPQDKVCEFAAQTPVDLLYSTQRAVAPEYMLEWHDNLKMLRTQQKKVQAEHETDKETLLNLDGRQQTLRADVERLHERAAIQERVRMLELGRPITKYRVARNLHTESKQRRKDAERALKELEDEVEPSLRAVNAKQDYCAQIEQEVKARVRRVEKAEHDADDLVKKLQDLQDKLNDVQQQARLEKESEKTRKQDVNRIEVKIKNLERQMRDEQVEFDGPSHNEKIREKKRQGGELQMMVSQLQATQRELVSQGKERNAQIAEKTRELESLDSQAGQQGIKLKNMSRETAQAWHWIQDHQDEFEHRVFGPPVVECSVKDPKYVDAVEASFQKNDLVTFTVQSYNDFKKLSAQLYGTLRLADITIRTCTGGLDQFRPPISDQQMRSFGFEGWALDYLAGPEPVLAMLCSECKINQTGVALGDISDRQYEALQSSPISSWVTGKASFQITRRREYGPGATSTRVRDLKKAQIWTNQPVDMTAKRDLQESIHGWGEEVDELKRQIEEANEKIAETRGQVLVLNAEKKELEDKKAAEQKAWGEWKALPTRRDQLVAQRDAKEAAGVTFKSRALAFVEQADAVTLEKARLARDYAISVEKMQQIHDELMEAELMHIEAVSDLQVLTSRNSDVKEMLETNRRELDELGKQTEETARQARALLEECKAVLADPEHGQKRKDFMNSFPDDQSPEELENEISAENARLELLHVGNSNAIIEYENRQKTIDRLTEKVGKMEERLEAMDAGITEIRDKWEPELDTLIGAINDAFAHSFEKIGCAGQVGVHKDDDFDQWAIQIQVKFRENEPLSLLTSHRQSGGERAVSTIFYLMALQSLARAPFRVVDEINQGMDPRNERMVHERMVDIACKEHTSQYFLITPKLLHGLRYHPRMTVLCIASGEYMPPAGGHALDFGACVERKLALRQTAVEAVGA